MTHSGHRVTESALHCERQDERGKRLHSKFCAAEACKGLGPWCPARALSAPLSRIWSTFEGIQVAVVSHTSLSGWLLGDCWWSQPQPWCIIPNLWEHSWTPDAWSSNNCLKTASLHAWYFLWTRLLPVQITCYSPPLLMPGLCTHHPQPHYLYTPVAAMP